VLPVALALLLHAAPEERFDHHGAVGLLLGVGGLRKESSFSLENTWRGSINVGGTFNVGYRSNEIVLMASVSMTRTDVLVQGTDQHIYGFGIDGVLWGGFRGYFGDRWKTFVDLDLALAVGPGFTAGPRFGFGVQYELSGVAGVFATLAAQLGFGSGLVFRAELMIGVQLRSFLLED
jgi:hypothetical protein